MALKVAIIGSGNWGSAIARNVGLNCLNSSRFSKNVNMWVFEETITVEDKPVKLTEYINTHHENKKYLPGIALPSNIVAIPQLTDAVKDANILIFVMPHQFVKGACKSIKGSIAKDAFSVSLCKGFEFTDSGIDMISHVISSELNIPCGVLMGANLAKEVANDQFAEATIATENEEHGNILRELFNRPSFRCACVKDIAAVEMCGALKNIVAVGAGFIDALGMGNNTKAAVIRLGLMEIISFSNEFYNCKVKSVFFESCGVADLVTTCYGGRHARLARMFVETGKPFAQLEQEELNGQKLQGPQTAEKVHKLLKMKGDDAVKRYPLFEAVYKIAYENLPANAIINEISHHPLHY